MDFHQALLISSVFWMFDNFSFCANFVHKDRAGVQVPGTMYIVPGSWCAVPGAQCYVPGTRYLVSSTLYQVPGASCAPGPRYKVPVTRARYQVPDT